MTKVHVVIGASHSGKTSFVENVFIKDSEMTEFRDEVVITETDEYYLIGPYDSIDERTKGTDRVSRADIRKIYTQVVSLAKEGGKDVVVEGDKITSRPFMNSLIDAELDVNLYWIKVSSETSISRNRKAGSTSKDSQLKAVTTKAKNLFNEYKMLCESYIVDSENVLDFREFDMRYAEKLETEFVEMRDDFALFILSNGRPDEQLSLNLMLDHGYTGDWYILCDNLDETLDRYKEIYGDKVIVFNKEEWGEKTDTFGNEKDMRSVVYARNASMHIAREMGYKYMAQFDDDHQKYVIRYEDEGSLRTGGIGKRMNEIVNAFVGYLENSPVGTLTFGYGAPYIGGLNGEFSKGLGTSWVYSTFFIDLEYDFEFRGLHVEDYIFVSDYMKRGIPMYSVYDIQMSTFSRGSNAGGLQDIYDSSSDYEVAFYALMNEPKAVEVTLKTANNKFATTQRPATRTPKVLNERWRKDIEK